MRKRKMTPEEMARTVALGILAVERATAAAYVEPCHSTGDSANANAGVDAPKFSPQDVRWMKAIGIRLA
jgi:hypothetical protein